jgi:hypothetical protein
MFAQKRRATGTAQTMAAIAEPAVERTTSDSSLFGDLADLASYDSSSSDSDLDDSPAKVGKSQVKKLPNQPRRPNKNGIALFYRDAFLKECKGDRGCLGSRLRTLYRIPLKTLWGLTNDD